MALYLAAHVAFRLRNVGSVNWPRVITALACLALIPAAMELAGVLMLAVLCALFAALIAYEALRYAEARARIRAERVGH